MFKILTQGDSLVCQDPRGSPHPPPTTLGLNIDRCMKTVAQGSIDQWHLFNFDPQTQKFLEPHMTQRYLFHGAVLLFARKFYN